MIAKNTIFWRKENGGYKLYRYGTEEFRKVCGWGDHAPPLEEVRKAGFMTDLILPIDSATQKNGNRVDDGLSCWLEVIDKTAEEIAAERKALVPYEVTMRQARIMLLSAGILAQVDLAISGMDEASKITWEYSQTVQRANPLVTLIGVSFGLTEDDLDTMFIEANKI